MTAAEQHIDTIPAGTYSNVEDFIRDFGDITWTVDKDELERLHKKFKDALWYLQYMNSADEIINQSISISKTMILADIGRALVKAAWENGYLAEHLEKAGGES